MFTDETVGGFNCCSSSTVLKETLNNKHKKQYKHLKYACIYLYIIPHPSLQTPILQFHSGYQKADLVPVVRKLHGTLSAPPDDKLRAIRNKYSHK